MKRFRKLFQQLKDLAWRLLPKPIVRPIAKAYRRLRAWLAALLFNFPGKKLKVIGITGTNGKTTTASYIGSILEAAGYKVAISSTAFFQIGDKKWINDTNFTADYTFQLQRFLAKAKRKKCDYVILEVTAHGLEQSRGLWGINYLATAMTNLTQDHLDYFEDMQTYAAAKSKLFATLPEVTALNRDDEWYDYFSNFPATRENLSYGTDASSDIRITSAVLRPHGSEFRLTLDKTNIWDFSTQLSGKFNVYNAAAAVAITYGLRVDKKAIIKGVEKLELVPGRMQPIVAGQNFSVLVDYAHTPDALKNVLETLSALTANRVILVFGATGDRDKAKRPIMGEIAAKYADRIILTDEEPYKEDPAQIRAAVMKGIIKAKGEAKTNELAERRAAIKKAFSIAKKGDSVIITGMGHQEYMTLASGKIPWNDARVAEDLLSELVQKKPTKPKKKTKPKAKAKPKNKASKNKKTRK